MVDDALDFAAVDAEYAGYGALVAACIVPGSYRLFYRWRTSWHGCGMVLDHGCRFALMTGLAVLVDKANMLTVGAPKSVPASH